MPLAYDAINFVLLGLAVFCLAVAVFRSRAFVKSLPAPKNPIGF